MVGALLLLVVAVIGAASVGDWDRPDTGGDATGPDVPPPSDELQTPVLPSDFPTELTTDLTPNPEVFRTLIWAATAVLVVLLGLALLRLLRRLRAPAEDLVGAGEHLVGVAGADPVHAPELREGIAQAQQRMEEEREPRDAVLRAWLALEAAAARAGARRRPSQTATEFTAAVLARTDADDDAVATLREAYLRVRFSEAPLTEADAERARAALRVVASSWSDVGSEA